jgi:hypothetical protein
MNSKIQNEIEIYALVREKSNDYEFFKEEHFESRFVVVHSNTKTDAKNSKFSLQKKMGCMLGKDKNEKWCAKLNYWEYVFNVSICVSMDMLNIFEDLSNHNLETEKQKTKTAPMREAYKALFREEILSMGGMYECCGVFVTYHKRAKPNYMNVTFKFKQSASQMVDCKRPSTAFTLNVHLIPPSIYSGTTNPSSSLRSILNESKALLMHFFYGLNCESVQKTFNSLNKFKFTREGYTVSLTDCNGKLTHLNTTAGWQTVHKTGKR